MKKISPFRKFVVHPFVVITLLISQVAVAQNYNPVADPAAVVTSENARFTVLTPSLIRMEYDQESKFQDQASLVIINRNLPVPTFKKNVKNNKTTIETDQLKLVYTDDGKPFHQGNLSVTFKVAGKPVKWYPGMTDTLNLKGTNRTLDGVKGWEGQERLEDGLVSRSGWALVDDSQTLLFTEEPITSWVENRQDTLQIDWYLFAHGHNYEQVLKDFTAVSGQIPMPPKFTFGYWWSRYWIYSDYEIRELVKQIKDYAIPIDVFIVDMDWHETTGLSAINGETDSEGEMKGWTGYTWNRSLFPKPDKFLEWTGQQNLKTALNLHPASGIPPNEEKYDDFAKAYGFDTSSGKNIPFAMGDKKWSETYFDLVLDPMSDAGVDFWWLDWQQYLYDKKVKGLNNTWWLNHRFFTNMQEKGEERPLIFHRWGGLGNHRYQVGFSGDAYANWETLDYEVYFTHTAANVGYGYWSHDIGGHILTDEADGELYLRWIQFGAFSPILRTHATKKRDLERRIWKYTDHFEDMRDAIRLRYSLAPYVYNASRITYDSGVSICRPLYYTYPESEQAYKFKTQYMFGEDILVAPVSTPVAEETALASKEFWLPEGSWYEYSTGSMLNGNSVLERTYSESEIPFFIKAGAIIPMNAEVDNLQTEPRLKVLAFVPGTAVSETTLYEDDGETDAYRDNVFATRKAKREYTTEKQLKINISPSEGSYEGMPSETTFRMDLLNTLPPEKVWVNGKEILYSDTSKTNSWRYNSIDFTTEVFVSEVAPNQTLEVMADFGTTHPEQQQILDGNKGFLKRMSWVTERLKEEVLLKDWTGTLPNEVYEFNNVYNRLRYNPSSAYQEIKELNKRKESLDKLILGIPALSEEVTLPLLKHLSYDAKEME